GAPGNIDDTADEVTARGGVGVPVRADCTAEADVAAAFDRVDREQGKVDVLANAVWGGGDAFLSMDDWQSSWGRPFWDQRPRPGRWQHTMTAGPYAYFLAGCQAARRRAAAGRGLIVGVTDFVVPGAEAEGEGGSGGLVLSELAHDCINRLLRGMAGEAKPHG